MSSHAGRRHHFDTFSLDGRINVFGPRRQALARVGEGRHREIVNAQPNTHTQWKRERARQRKSIHSRNTNISGAVCLREATIAGATSVVSLIWLRRAQFQTRSQLDAYGRCAFTVVGTTGLEHAGQWATTCAIQTSTSPGLVLWSSAEDASVSAVSYSVHWAH